MGWGLTVGVGQGAGQGRAWGESETTVMNNNKKKKIDSVGTYCKMESSLGLKFWLWDKKNILANFALLHTRQDYISNFNEKLNYL